MKIIEEFLLEHSTNIILSRVKISKCKLFNGLEGFWGYLKRKLSSKGGIRRERLPLYLGEYVWRYNYRKLSLKEQKSRLFTLIFNNFRS
jgi:transposase-like protein